MRNAEIAAAFNELATLYELDGAVRYRVLAYRDAAKVVRDHGTSVAEMAREGRATEIKGIGDTLQEKIVALLDEGEIPAARKLKETYPAGLVEVTRVPGLGAKTARRLFDELGVENLDHLKAHAEAGDIQKLKGLGPKAEDNILAELAKLDAAGGPVERRLLSDVLEIGAELADALREHPGCERVAVAGSARRWTETCKDIDLIATATDPSELAQAFREHPLAAESGSGGEGGAKIRTHNDISVDLRIVEPAEYGNLLQHFTGSAAHNVELRERALKMGLSVSEHGITEVESGKVTPCETEEEVYERLGLAYIEPELREGRGEIKAAESGELPELVEVGDIRGDLHSHTTLSDGKNTLREMADAARDRGYAYLAVTDHSATHGFGNDVQPDALLRRVEQVHELNEEMGKGFTLLSGSEVNIEPDGGLDYSDDVLAELDWVIASVHTSFRMGAEKLTARIIEAINHPRVDCIGHLTGRLIGRREPYDIDVEAIIAAAAANGTMFEINGNPNRRDLSEHHARLAADAGVKIVINTDAHRTSTLSNIVYGVATARRAWLGPDQIANTRTWPQLRKLKKG